MRRFLSRKRIILFEFFDGLFRNFNFQHNTNVCLSDYAFPYIILVLSLVTLAVYMSASEIEVGCLFSFVKEFFVFFFLNRFDY